MHKRPKICCYCRERPRKKKQEKPVHLIFQVTRINFILQMFFPPISVTAIEMLTQALLLITLMTSGQSTAQICNKYHMFIRTTYL